MIEAAITTLDQIDGDPDAEESDFSDDEESPNDTAWVEYLNQAAG